MSGPKSMLSALILLLLFFTVACRDKPAEAPDAGQLLDQVSDSSAWDQEPQPRDLEAGDTGDDPDLRDAGVDNQSYELPDAREEADQIQPDYEAQEDVVQVLPSIDLFRALLDQEDQSGLEAFAQDYTGPLCDQLECLVLTRLPGAQDVRIRGEFNSWEDQTFMTEVAFLPGYFFTLLQPPPGRTCFQYKLFADGEWLEDPMNLYIRFADIAVNNTICAVDAFRLARVQNIWSPELSNTRDVFVFLPPVVFQNPGLRVPVLYMQDGFNVFTNPQAPYGSWEVDTSTDQLIREGEVRPLIIVGVDTDDRMNEYLYSDLTLDLGDELLVVTPRLEPYGRFLTQTLKPLIDKTFPTLDGPENTGIAGSSLGGISSLWLGWTHPEVFGLVGSFSGSYWVGMEGSGTEGHPTMPDLLGTNPSSAQAALKIYLDSGTVAWADWETTYGADARVFTDWVRNRLISMGWPNRSEWDDDDQLSTPPMDFSPDADPSQVPTLFWADPPPGGDWEAYLRPDLSLLHLVGQGQGHNEAAWRSRFPAALRFLFPPL